jgi:hypothetical protein
LPWNPMKVEQRIGRIDRLGQKAEKIIIWNLFYKDTIDSRIYHRLHERLEIFKTALGGFEAILGEEIQKLTLSLLLGKLTSHQEEERIEQTAQAIENTKKHEEELEQEAAHLVAYGDYILNQVKAARQLHRWVSGNDIQTYVFDFLKLYFPGCEFIQVKDDFEFEVNLTHEVKQELEEFIRHNKIDGRTGFIRNDPSPVRCKFENKVNDGGKSRTEIVNQSHALVRWVSSKLNNQEEHYYPAVMVAVNNEFLKENISNGIYIFTIQHWSIQGIQEIEKLSYSAVDYKTGSLLSEEDSELLITQAAISARDWFEGRELDIKRVISLANENCLHDSDLRYAEFVKDLQNQNEDRADLQERTLNWHLQNQLAKLNAVLDKHTLAGRAPLAKATEGRISALENRFERKKLEINKRRKMVPSKNDICVGVVNVL